MNAELVAYIKQRLAMGASPDVITNELKAGNWKDEDIANAFQALSSPANPASDLPIAPTNPQVDTVAEPQSSQPEKKHDTAWVVVNILWRGGILGGVTYLALLGGMAIFSASMVVSDPDHFKDIVKEGVSGGGPYFVILGILFYLTAIVVSFLGYQRGCRYAQKKTLIDQKDFFKIGYWVGLVPVVFNLLPSGPSFKISIPGVVSLIVGIFILPPLVRRWLTDGLDPARPKQARDRKLIWTAICFLLLITIGGFFLLAGKIRETIKNESVAQPAAQEQAARSDLSAALEPLPKEQVVDYGPYEKAESPRISRSVFGFEYQKDGKSYIKVQEKDLGPFQRARLNIGDSDWSYISVESGTTFYVNTKDKRYGPFNIASGDPHFVFSSSTWAYIRTEDKRSFVNIGEKEYGPYDSVRDLMLYGDVWTYQYILSGKGFINNNGRVYGPYEDIDINSWPMGSVNFRYSSEGKYYENYGDKIYGPYAYLMSFSKSRDGSMEIVEYMKDRKSRQSFVSVNGKEYGPYYAGNTSFVTNSQLNTWAIVYKTDENGKFFVKTSDQEYGPFDAMDSYGFVKGDICYSYRIAESYYYKCGDKEYSSEQRIWTEISEDQNTIGFLYQKGGKSFININDRIIDENTGSDFKNLMVHNKLVGFIYTKDGKKFVSVNNETYGPYDEVGYLRGYSSAFEGEKISVARWGFNYRVNDQWFVKGGVVY